MGRSWEEATKARWSLRLRAILLALRGLRRVLAWRTCEEVRLAVAWVLAACVG
jgi:hypothetical protein